MEKAVFIRTSADGYNPSQVSKTMTVGELVEHLSNNFDQSLPIYLDNDDRYSFGGIVERRIYVGPIGD